MAQNKYKNSNYASDAPPGNHKGHPNEDQEKYNNPLTLDRGVLKVDALMATGINVDSFGRSAPFVIMKYGRTKLKSRTHEGGRSNPVWNERFIYNIPNVPQDPPLLHCEIWNYHATRKNTLLGRVSVKNILEYISKYPAKLGYMWLPIFAVRNERNRQGIRAQHTGNILVRFYFESKEDQYFGDGLNEGDHTVKWCDGQKKYDDITHDGNTQSYTVVEDFPVQMLAGTVINLTE